MIVVNRYSGLLNKRVKVVCEDGQCVIGEWIDWTSEADNDPDPESVTLRSDDGVQIEVFVKDIVGIDEAAY